VFLGEFRQKRTSENLRRCRFKLCMESFVRLGIDRDVQPVLLIVQSDRSLVNHNLSRIPIRFGL